MGGLDGGLRYRAPYGAKKKTEEKKTWWNKKQRNDSRDESCKTHETDLFKAATSLQKNQAACWDQMAESSPGKLAKYQTGREEHKYARTF